MRFTSSLLVLLGLANTAHASRLSQCMTSVDVDVTYRDLMTSGPFWNPDFQSPSNGWTYVSPEGYIFPWGTSNFCFGDIPAGCPSNCNPNFGACNLDGRGALQQRQVQTQLQQDGTPAYRNNGGAANQGDNYAHSIWGNQTFWSWYHDVPFGGDLHQQGYPPNCVVQSKLTLTRIPGTNLFHYDSSAGGASGFFPLTGKCWDDPNYIQQTIGPNNNVPPQALQDGNGVPQNFGFTSHVSGAFEFQGTETFVFCGDDDVWVFIDGHLVVDIGGVHPERCRAFDLTQIDAQGFITPYECGQFPCDPSTLQPSERAFIGNLVQGQTYEMAIFQAERHTIGSNFVLTTSIAWNLNTYDMQFSTPTVVLNERGHGGGHTGSSAVITSQLIPTTVCPEFDWTFVCESTLGLVEPVTFTFTHCTGDTSFELPVSLINDTAAINNTISKGIGHDTMVCSGNAPAFYPDGTPNPYAQANNRTFGVSFYRFPPVISVQGGDLVTLVPQIPIHATFTDIDTPQSSLSVVWSLVSGPGVNSTLPSGTGSLTDVSVVLSGPGVYVFRVTVDDGDNVVSQDINVHYLPPTTAPPTKPLPTLPGPVNPCARQMFGGVVDGYNLWSFGSWNSQASSVGGAVAVAGDAHISSYYVGMQLTNRTQMNLIVGGALSWSQGTLTGTGLVAGAASVDRVVSSGISSNAPLPAPLGGAFFTSQLLPVVTLAQQLTADTLYGTRLTPCNSATAYGTWTISAVDNDMCRVEIDGAHLGESNIVIHGSQTAIVVVVIRGTSWTWQYHGMSLVGGITATNLLWVSLAATGSITMNGVGFQGSLLAPYASVTFNNGQFNGQLIAGSVTGSGNLNTQLFCATNTPRTTPTLLRYTFNVSFVFPTGVDQSDIIRQLTQELSRVLSLPTDAIVIQLGSTTGLTSVTALAAARAQRILRSGSVRSLDVAQATSTSVSIQSTDAHQLTAAYMTLLQMVIGSGSGHASGHGASTLSVEDGSRSRSPLLSGLVANQPFTHQAGEPLNPQL